MLHVLQRLKGRQFPLHHSIKFRREKLWLARRASSCCGWGSVRIRRKTSQEILESNGVPSVVSNKFKTEWPKVESPTVDAPSHITITSPRPTDGMVLLTVCPVPDISWWDTGLMLRIRWLIINPSWLAQTAAGAAITSSVLSLRGVLWVLSNGAPACRAYLLTLKPALQTAKVEDMPTRKFLWSQLFHDPRVCHGIPRMHHITTNDAGVLSA
jgi:hypothetical protein